MKIAFYSPYLPDSSIGGGEKHLFDMAVVLAEEHQVSVLIRSDAAGGLGLIRSKYQKFFDADLSKIEFVAAPLGTKVNPFKKLWFTSQFDYLFYWTDGSLFFSLARQNNLHLQIPFTAPKNRVIDRFKLLNWQVKNANSKFTKSIVEQSWNTRVPYVINPMVDADLFSPETKKEKLILNVGRFFRQLHSKRQDVLVGAFKKMVDSQPEMRSWRLVLIGAAEDKQYVDTIAKAAKGYNIELMHQVTRGDLIKIYNKASLYWHATGFGVDELQYPEKMEHFGIATIEAMAAGAVPIVINKGGQPEILGNQLQDCLWNSTEELIDKTVSLVKDQNELYEKSQLAVNVVLKYSRHEFTSRVKKMIQETS